MIYYDVYRHHIEFHRVWRSNAQERPCCSKILSWNDLVCLSMFRRVLHVNFRYNSCDSSLNHIRSCLGLNQLGKHPQGPFKGLWGRTLVSGQNCPRQSHLLMANDGQWPGRCPLCGGTHMVHRLGAKLPVLSPSIHRLRTGRPVCGPPPRLWVTVVWVLCYAQVQ